MPEKKAIDPNSVATDTRPTRKSARIFAYQADGLTFDASKIRGSNFQQNEVPNCQLTARFGKKVMCEGACGDGAVRRDLLAQS